MVGASSLFTLIAGVAIISPDVRAQIAHAMSGDAAGQLGAVASRALDFAHVLMRLAADYRTDNAPLLGFGLVAVVLTVMMARN